MAEQIAALIATRQRLMRELSHELRSPLARMQAAVGLATGRGSLTESERTRIELEVTRMDRIIGDLLKFSRLDAAPAMNRRLVRLDEVLAELTEDEELEARRTQCSLKLTAARGLTIVGDAELLRSGLENILRNAIRYTPPGGAVEITAAKENETIAVTISDCGPGVPAQDLARIFEPFVRVPTGRSPDAATATDEGTGLGLAIARRVFEAHGGTVSAAARPGGGLEVTVRIPAADLI